MGGWTGVCSNMKLSLFVENRSNLKILGTIVWVGPLSSATYFNFKVESIPVGFTASTSVALSGGSSYASDCVARGVYTSPHMHTLTGRCEHISCMQLCLWTLETPLKYAEIYIITYVCPVFH